MTPGPALLLLAIALIGLAFTACEGGEPTSPAAGNNSDAERYSLQGKIAIDGSSTVFPDNRGGGRGIRYSHPRKVRITVGVSGTGGGFQKFCNGETNISDASRPIKASEAELCAQRGIEFVEIPVAIDGLTVMVNPENDFVSCVTVAELHQIWGAEAETRSSVGIRCDRSGRTNPCACTVRG